MPKPPANERLPERTKPKPMESLPVAKKKPLLAPVSGALKKLKLKMAPKKKVRR